MELWLSVPLRVSYLVVLLALLLTLESRFPLATAPRRGWRRAGVNLALTLLVLVVNLGLATVSSAAAAWTETNGIGLVRLVPLAPWMVLLIGMVGLDLCAYLAHIGLHFTQIGWRLHRVHHSDPQVDVTTALRQHPGESVVRFLAMLAGSLVLGVPLWVVVSYLTVSSMSAQLEHASLFLPASLDRFARLVVVTPNMHRVHHSRHAVETDSNFSNIFAFWDHLGGTYRRVDDVQSLVCGLDGFDDTSRQSLAGLLRLPWLA